MPLEQLLPHLLLLTRLRRVSVESLAASGDWWHDDLAALCRVLEHQLLDTSAVLQLLLELRITVLGRLERSRIRCRGARVILSSLIELFVVRRLTRSLLSGLSRCTALVVLLEGDSR